MVDKILVGKTGSYTLDTLLASGGEGNIYKIRENDRVLAKLYHPAATSPEKLAALEAKLKAMVADTSVDPICRGAVRFVWPKDVLYDKQSGAFVGYLQPFVGKTFELSTILSPDKRSRLPLYDYNASIAVAFNVAQAVAYLHEKGYVIGDLTDRTFQMDEQGRVVMFGVDCLEFADAKTPAHTVYDIAYAAPELQTLPGLPVPQRPFTGESDDFSLAILIFRLLMEGFHPFTGVPLHGMGCPGAGENIARGRCPYVRADLDIGISRSAPPFRMLSPELQALFRRTFTYGSPQASLAQRPNAKAYATALYAFYRDTDKTRCDRNPAHLYLSRLGKCPLCNNL